MDEKLAQMKAEMLKTLAQSAVDRTYYVALQLGVVKAFADKYNLPLNKVEGALAEQACNLVDYIHQAKTDKGECR